MIPSVLGAIKFKTQNPPFIRGSMSLAQIGITLLSSLIFAVSIGQAGSIDARVQSAFSGDKTVRYGGGCKITDDEVFDTTPAGCQHKPTGITFSPHWKPAAILPDAIAFCKAHNTKAVGGFTDWRLPRYDDFVERNPLKPTKYQEDYRYPRARHILQTMPEAAEMLFFGVRYYYPATSPLCPVGSFCEGTGNYYEWMRAWTDQAISLNPDLPKKQSDKARFAMFLNGEPYLTYQGDNANFPQSAICIRRGIAQGTGPIQAKTQGRLHVSVMNGQVRFEIRQNFGIGFGAVPGSNNLPADYYAPVYLKSGRVIKWVKVANPQLTAFTPLGVNGALEQAKYYDEEGGEIDFDAARFHGRKVVLSGAWDKLSGQFVSVSSVKLVQENVLGTCAAETDRFRNTTYGCQDLASSGKTWFTFKGVLPDEAPFETTVGFSRRAFPEYTRFIKELPNTPRFVFKYQRSSTDSGLAYFNPNVIREDYLPNRFNSPNYYPVTPMQNPGAPGGKTVGPSKTCNDQKALRAPQNLCQKLNEYAVNGITSWRVPTRDEAKTIAAQNVADIVIPGNPWDSNRRRVWTDTKNVIEIVDLDTGKVSAVQAPTCAQDQQKLLTRGDVTAGAVDAYVLCVY